MSTDEGFKYSVLMSVYQNETAEHLKSAMDSMWNQTIPTNDFVLVCDGPLTPSLDRVVELMEYDHPHRLHVVRLKENHGLGYALAIGLKKCKNDLIARMDSDDESRLDRCEKQLNVFKNNPQISICSGTIEEFISDKQQIISRRILPETQEQIEFFMKSRNPFNHVAVMYRKQAVIEAGNYQSFYFLEDYYLWIRMIRNGSKGYNIPDPLVWVRIGEGMYRRRGGCKYIFSQIKLFKYMYDNKLITFIDYCKNILIRLISGALPAWFRQRLYMRYNRK